MLDTAAVAGVLASRNHDASYFTSNLYPIEVEDSFGISPIGALSGYYYGVPDEQFSFGTVGVLEGRMVDTIHYASYTHQYEVMQMNMPSVLQGTLTHVIDYPVYDHPTPEEFRFGRVNMLVGTITTVINYVTYNMSTEGFSVGRPAVLAGDLV